MLCVSCYVLLCHAHILEDLYDLISFESNRLLGIRIDSNRVDSSRFVKIFHLPAHLFATWLPVSLVPLNGLPVSQKCLILELTRIVFALRQFDSVWVYWTWVHISQQGHKCTLPYLTYFTFPLQKCPFEAITIINLPSNLEKETTHRYSANSFKLHRFVCQQSCYSSTVSFDFKPLL